MSDAPNAKRRRTDSTDATETSEQPIIRSTDHWFDDGNIILQIQFTQFRLYKGILSLHSSVFRDMFSIPLPPDEPMLEGCAIVALSGDTVQDWIYLLNAIYPRDPHPPIAVVPSLAIVSAFLRLGKKYDFTRFRKDALLRLKVEFPSTFTDWQKRVPYRQIKFEEDLEISVLMLAREMGLYSVLPTVYFDIVCVPNMKRKIRDGDDASGLSPAERLVCLQGYLKILELQADTIFEWLYGQGPIGTLCTTVEKCSAGRKDIKCVIQEPRFPEIWVGDQWEAGWDGCLCNSCANEGKQMFNSQKKACWDKIPSMFGLPDWPELLTSDFEHE
ncbi:hypothetical protein C8J57DRAFT_1360344 [Mycena rebaudengoi]|nr:hypothetical protein C8J57DRAFT_1360344 [Mycena rebaudengoi]